MEFKDRKYDLVTFGQLLMRLSPAPGERLQRTGVLDRNAGGAEFNVAAGASQMGLKTAMIAKLPTHAVGQFMKGAMKGNGVSEEYVIADESPDARVGLYYYEYGASPRKPSTVYDRRDSSIYSLTMDEIDESVFENTKCFHTTGITMALSPELRELTKQLIRKFKEHGALVSFDVNYRANLWSGDEARKAITEILPSIDIFFCSDSTARLTFLKEGTTREIIRSFTEEYPIKAVFATDRTVHSPKVHDFTSIAYSARDHEFYEEKGYEGIDVTDRIGSGDQYISGALYGILHEGGDIRRAVIYGNAAAALKNTVPGDLPVTSIEEIRNVIEAHYSEGFQTEMNR